MKSPSTLVPQFRQRQGQRLLTRLLTNTTASNSSGKQQQVSRAPWLDTSAEYAQIFIECDDTISTYEGGVDGDFMIFTLIVIITASPASTAYDDIF